MTQNVIKFSLGALGMALMGIAVLFAIHFFDPAYRQMQETVQSANEIRQEYKNDIYGGYTPEETVRLFVEALKKGNTESAAKYIVLDKRGVGREDLSRLKERKMLDNLVKDFESRQFKESDGDTARYMLATDSQASPLTLIKAPNGKWKISDF